jgi:hypothetical protein
MEDLKGLHSNYLGLATVGYDKDAGLEGGVGIFGAEAHLGVNAFNKGSLLTISGGVSYTNENGQKVGHDVQIGVGGETVATILLATTPGGLGRLIPWLLK